MSVDQTLPLHPTKRTHTQVFSWRPECRRRDVARVGRFDWERALRGRHGLRGVGLAIALGAATYASRDGGDVRPGEERLASDVGVSTRTVRRHLADLVARGLMLRAYRGGGRPSRHGRAYLKSTRRGSRYAEFQLALPDNLRPDKDPAEAVQRTPFGTSTTSPSRSTTRAATTPATANTASLQAELEKILGTHLTAADVDRISTGALALATEPVRSPTAWITKVVSNDPRHWRPVPTVATPDCPLHPGEPVHRCTPCRDAAGASTTGRSWRDGPIGAALKRPPRT